MIVRSLWVTRKEFIHIFRAPRTPAIVFLIPAMQLLLLGYTVTTDIKHQTTATLHQDRTRRSRALVEAYRASGYCDMALSQVISLNYVLVVVRSIMLKGAGLQFLGGEVLSLAIFGGVVLALAAARFQKRLD